MNMEKEELDRRKAALLTGDRLIKTIRKMLVDKRLSAKLESLTTFAGSYGKDELAIGLSAYDALAEAEIRVTILLPEAIYEEDGFARADSWIPDDKGIDMDTRTALRVLRTVFATAALINKFGVVTQRVDASRPIRIRYQDEGWPTYYNI